MSRLKVGSTHVCTNSSAQPGFGACSTVGTVLYSQHRSEAAAKRQAGWFRNNTTSRRDAQVMTAAEFLARTAPEA